MAKVLYLILASIGVIFCVIFAGKPDPTEVNSLHTGKVIGVISGESEIFLSGAHKCYICTFLLLGRWRMSMNGKNWNVGTMQST